MIFQQYYLDCLSHASYLVGDESTGRAVVVDPRRDVAAYLEDAAALGLTIDLVLETHLHADFLSGHLELAAATGAEVAFGAAAPVEFEARALHDGERISLGTVELEILETPGHTPESICVVVYEQAGDEVPYAVLTGDTLFIGDVGRPDLLSAVGHTADGLARQLYHSLRDKLLPLPGPTRVFPAHGAGSACGKNLSTETMSTMADQRLLNYALQPMSEDEFVATVTDGQPAAPGYFAYDALKNRRMRPLLDESAPLRYLDLEDLDRAVAAGALVLDTRSGSDFAAGHLAGSVNVGLDSRFAEYAGSVVEPDRPVVLVADPGTEREAVIRLGRIGFDDVVGVLADPLAAMAARPERVARASRITATQLREAMTWVPGLQVVDVRNPGEVAAGVINTPLVKPLGTLRSQVDDLDPARPTVVYCASGVRSVTAASLLRQRGFADVSDLAGGYAAWEAAATSS